MKLPRLLAFLLVAFSTLVSAATTIIVPSVNVKVWWDPQPLKDSVSGTLANPEPGSLTYELWGGKQGATPVLVAQNISELLYVIPSPPASIRCYFVIAVYINPTTKVVLKSPPSNTQCASVPAVPPVSSNLVPLPPTNVQIEVQVTP